MALCLRERLYTEGLARCHDRPCDPGKLVGERHRDEPRGPAREQRDDPIAQSSIQAGGGTQALRRAVANLASTRSNVSPSRSSL